MFYTFSGEEKKYISIDSISNLQFTIEESYNGMNLVQKHS